MAKKCHEKSRFPDCDKLNHTALQKSVGIAGKNNDSILQHYRKNPPQPPTKELLPKRSSLVTTGRRNPTSRPRRRACHWPTVRFSGKLFLFTSVLMFRRGHCLAGKPIGGNLKEEPEPQLQVILDSTSRISLFLELLKLSAVRQPLLLVQDRCSSAERCKRIHKLDKVTDTQIFNH